MEGRLEQAIEGGIEGPSSVAILDQLTKLMQDLRLAEDRAVHTARDLDQMLDCLDVLEAASAGRELGQRARLGRTRSRVDLDPMACPDDEPRRVFRKAAQRIAECFSPDARHGPGVGDQGHDPADSGRRLIR
jgi:hypothetical protein